MCQGIQEPSFKLRKKLYPNLLNKLAMVELECFPSIYLMVRVLKDDFVLQHGLEFTFKEVFLEIQYQIVYSNHPVEWNHI